MYGLPAWQGSRLCYSCGRVAAACAAGEGAGPSLGCGRLSSSTKVPDVLVLHCWARAVKHGLSLRAPLSRLLSPGSSLRAPLRLAGELGMRAQGQARGRRTGTGAPTRDKTRSSTRPRSAPARRPHPAKQRTGSCDAPIRTRRDRHDMRPPVRSLATNLRTIVVALVVLTTLYALATALIEFITTRAPMEDHSGHQMHHTHTEDHGGDGGGGMGGMSMMPMFFMWTTASLPRPVSMPAARHSAPVPSPEPTPARAGPAAACALPSARIPTTAAPPPAPLQNTILWIQSWTTETTLQYAISIAGLAAFALLHEALSGYRAVLNASPRQQQLSRPASDDGYLPLGDEVARCASGALGAGRAAVHGALLRLGAGGRARRRGTRTCISAYGTATDGRPPAPAPCGLHAAPGEADRARPHLLCAPAAAGARGCPGTPSAACSTRPTSPPATC